MSSTNEALLAAAMGPLFDEILMPLAHRLRNNGERPFPLEPDVSWFSYYERRKRASMTRADFTEASCSDVSELELKLAAHWQVLGRHRLAAQAARFGAAAREAKALLATEALEENLVRTYMR